MIWCIQACTLCSRMLQQCCMRASSQCASMRLVCCCGRRFSLMSWFDPVAKAFPYVLPGHLLMCCFVMCLTQFFEQAQQAGLTFHAMASSWSAMLAGNAPASGAVPVICPQTFEDAYVEWQVIKRGLHDPDGDAHRCGDWSAAVHGSVACPGCVTVPDCNPPGKVSMLGVLSRSPIVAVHGDESPLQGVGAYM